MSSRSDANTFLFVDQGNHAIRKLTIVKTTVPQDSFIGCVQTIAGGGTDTEALSGFKDANGLEARFSSPAGLAIGLDGTIFVADQGNHAVRGISPDDLNVHTLVGNGTQGNMDGQALDVRVVYERAIRSDRSRTSVERESADGRLAVGRACVNTRVRQHARARARLNGMPAGAQEKLRG